MCAPIDVIENKFQKLAYFNCTKFYFQLYLITAKIIKENNVTIIFGRSKNL